MNRAFLFLSFAIVLAGCSCAQSHQRDAGAGMDAFIPTDAGPPDAGPPDAPPLDAGTDTGPPHRCPPNPAYWIIDGGFPTLSGGVSPYCQYDDQCPIVGNDYGQDCWDGVCCNGYFDVETCTCMCGDEPGCRRGEACCAAGGIGPIECQATSGNCWEI
jgi:hypothetical protein